MTENIQSQINEAVTQHNEGIPTGALHTSVIPTSALPEESARKQAEGTITPKPEQPIADNQFEFASRMNIARDLHEDGFFERHAALTEEGDAEKIQAENIASEKFVFGVIKKVTKSDEHIRHTVAELGGDEAFIEEQLKIKTDFILLLLNSHHAAIESGIVVGETITLEEVKKRNGYEA